MLLKSLRMKNIRSYSDVKIDFPTGSTLLAGDIGTGKSTLLMAVDFALFGIRRGDMAGSDLLRHGADTGEIELDFHVDGKDVEIKRVLKRKKDGIAQEYGLIAVNGVRNEKTPTEMTASVLEMIGYPQQIARRPIFRYTVYTPQEQMKHIIESDDRLETLRRIFGVDKYGIIKSNSNHLKSLLREEKRNLEGYARDVEQKKKELEEAEKDKLRIAAEMERHSLLLKKIENEILAKRNEVDKAAREAEHFRVMKREMEKKRFEETTKTGRAEKNSREISALDERITEKRNHVEKYEEMKKPEMGAAEIKGALESLEKERDSVIFGKSRAQTHMENLEKILKRGICEICGQPVHDPQGFAAGISKTKELLSQLESREKEISAAISQHRKIQLDIREYEHAMERKADAAAVLRDAEKRRAALASENAELLREAEALEKEIALLGKEYAAAGEHEKILADLERKYYEMNIVYAQEQKKRGALEATLRETENAIRKISKEVAAKERALRQVSMLNELVKWVEDYFSPLMDSMEKNVMLAVQKEFNEYFQKWFSMLMSDALSVRIDEQFTPVIEQNSYETEYRNLSGGEKTSVALAYRLSLNHVINNMIHTIKTKDLLILDEPTDGFSTEQLDRIRDVLNELKLKQVIIVSHEPKIDTYVDNVIRVYKEEHVSRIAAG